MKAFTCETCGLSFTYLSGREPRWCEQDRAEGRRQRKPRPTRVSLEHGLASTVVTQRLAIEQAIHALSAAALARQLQWDDRTWLDAALDALIDIPTMREALT